MEIRNAVALVTGGNRGLGKRITEELLKRGAAKVYAAARDPRTVDTPGVVPLALDITDAASIKAAVAAAPDVTLLINNAGSDTKTSLVDGDIAGIERDMATNYFGPLNVTRAFAPVVAANGGGAVLNILSILSWIHFPFHGAYSVAKAAAWAMTNEVRQELAPRGIDVTALHVGYMDTDMADFVEPDKKLDPALVASRAVDGIEARTAEVLVGDDTQQVRAGLSVGVTALYPDLSMNA